MNKDFKTTISASGTEITVISSGDENDYISLTDIARYKSDDPTASIQNWMRSKETIAFLGLWVQLNNPNFNPIEFEGVRNEAGANAFTMSPKKWIEATGAIGIISKPGRYGGTFAHKDIAFEFASWSSAEFKLYIIRDYQRLKSDENSRISLQWNVNRILSKVNYRIHTDAIKGNLIPDELTQSQKSYVYADEADIINVALFGMTAAEWRKGNPDKKGNIRDYATIEQLLVLANMENMNAVYIEKGMPQKTRIEELNEFARKQLAEMLRNKSVKGFERLKPLPGDKNGGKTN